MYRLLNNQSNISQTSAAMNSDLASIDFASSEYILLALFLFSLLMFTIFGNLLVLLALYADSRLRLPSHYLMGSLAIADLLLG
jgi:hypothetical protein